MSTTVFRRLLAVGVSLCFAIVGLAALMSIGAVGGPGASLVILNCPGPSVLYGCDLSVRYSFRPRFAAVTVGPGRFYLWKWARGEPWRYEPVGFPGPDAPPVQPPCDTCGIVSGTFDSISHCEPAWFACEPDGGWKVAPDTKLLVRRPDGGLELPAPDGGWAPYDEVIALSRRRCGQ